MNIAGSMEINLHIQENIDDVQNHIISDKKLHKSILFPFFEYLPHFELISLKQIYYFSYDSGNVSQCRSNNTTITALVQLYVDC